MQLKELRSFYDSKDIEEVIKSYGYKIDNGCSGGFHTCVLTRNWRNPSKYLTFEISNKDEDIGLCDMMIVESKGICEDVEDKLKDLINNNTLKATEIDKNHKKYTLENFDISSWRNKLFFFGRTVDGRNPIVVFYNLESSTLY